MYDNLYQEIKITYRQPHENVTVHLSKLLCQAVAYPWSNADQFPFGKHTLPLKINQILLIMLHIFQYRITYMIQGNQNR